MFHISIALTLLTLMGGVLLLWKVKQDAMGGFAKWVAYIVIGMSIIMLLFDLTHGVMRMMHCDESHGAKYDHHTMMNGGHHEMCGGMQCGKPGKMHGGMNCHDEGPGHSKGIQHHDMEKGGGMKTDSASNN